MLLGYAGIQARLAEAAEPSNGYAIQRPRNRVSIESDAGCATRTHGQLLLGGKPINI